MTCIVGLVHDDTVYIGGDSAGVTGLSLTVRADEKVFVISNFIIGFTSSFRMGQLLRYRLKPPVYYFYDDILRYMVTDFVDSVRDSLKVGGFAKKDKDEESAGTFLVGFQGKLFKIDSDYQVSIPILPFDACGCGGDIALGSMYSSLALKPVERIMQALESAEQFSAGVRRPFIVRKGGIKNEDIIESAESRPIRTI